MEMNSEDNNPGHSTNSNSAITSINTSVENNTESKQDIVNKDLQYIIEAINNKNNSNIKELTNAFIRAIDEIKGGKNNDSEKSRNDNNDNNIYNNVPFHIKDFHLNSLNFNQWYNPLVHHLVSCNLMKFIETKQDIDSMSQLEIRQDNKTQSIIESSLDKDGNDILKGCKTAFEMMSRLKERYYQKGQSYLDNIDKQTKGLRIESTDFLSYIHKMDELYNLRKAECERMKKEPLDDEYKITHMFKELIKLKIHPLFIYLVDCNSYEKFKEKMYKLNSLMETIKNLTEDDDEYDHIINKVNRVQKGKLPYDFNNNLEDKENHKVHIEENFCYICEKYGHITKNCRKLKSNNNLKSNNKNHKQTKLNKGKKRKNNFEPKDSNKNFKSCFIKSIEEKEPMIEPDSDSDDLKSLNFN